MSKKENKRKFIIAGMILGGSCLAVSCLADQDQRQDNKVSFHLSIVLNDY